MLSGATCSAAAIVGTPVFRIVVSSDSMKNATAINHGSKRLLASVSEGGGEPPSIRPTGFNSVALGCIGLSIPQTAIRKSQLSPMRTSLTNTRGIVQAVMVLAARTGHRSRAELARRCGEAQPQQIRHTV